MKNFTTNIIIVGGGMAGLMCAERLQRAGIAFTLLEAKTCGDGASGASSGFITPDSEIDLSRLLHYKGGKDAKIIWEVSQRGVDQIKEVIDRYTIECDYTNAPSLFVAARKAGIRDVRDEHEARKKLGYASTYHNSVKEVQRFLGTTQYPAAVEYDGTFGINVKAFCTGLCDALRQQGADIREYAPVTKVDSGKVTTIQGEFSAKHIILCLDHSVTKLGFLKNLVFPVQTFLATSKPLPESTIRKLFPAGPRLVWDTDLLYHYIRPTADNRIVVGGSNLLYTYAGKPLRQPEGMNRHLHTHLKKIFPDLEWETDVIIAGLLGTSPDLLPLLFQEGNVLGVSAATGLSWASSLGVFLAEHLIHSDNALWEHFSVQRKFPFPAKLTPILGKRLPFAASHGYMKYLA